MDANHDITNMQRIKMISCTVQAECTLWLFAKSLTNVRYDPWVLWAGNMVLFDQHGKIRRYETPEDILQEFFTLRMEHYSMRRLNLTKVPLSSLAYIQCCAHYAAHQQYNLEESCAKRILCNCI